MAVLMVSRLQSECQLDMSVVHVFEKPTISALCSTLAEKGGDKSIHDKSRSRGAQRRQARTARRPTARQRSR